MWCSCIGAWNLSFPKWLFENFCPILGITVAWSTHGHSSCASDPGTRQPTHPVENGKDPLGRLKAAAGGVLVPLKPSVAQNWRCGCLWHGNLPFKALDHWFWFRLVVSTENDGGYPRFPGRYFCLHVAFFNWSCCWGVNAGDLLLSSCGPPAFYS